jgi:hypothetical protein
MNAPTGPDGQPLAPVVDTPWGLVGGLIAAAVLLIVLLGVIVWLVKRNRRNEDRNDAQALKVLPVNAAGAETMGDVMPPPPTDRKMYGALPRKETAPPGLPDRSEGTPSLYQPLSISEPSEGGDIDMYQALPRNASVANISPAYGVGEFVSARESARNL